MTEQFNQASIDSSNLDNIYALIGEELAKATKKFPGFPIDPVHAVSVMNEESGESIRAALQWTYENGSKEELKKELVQTTAMCFRCLAGLLSDDIKPSKE